MLCARIFFRPDLLESIQNNKNNFQRHLDKKNKPKERERHAINVKQCPQQNQSANDPRIKPQHSFRYMLQIYDNHESSLNIWIEVYNRQFMLESKFPAKAVITGPAL